MTTWVAAWLLGAVSTMLLVGLVVGMIWAFGAWIAGG